MIKLQQKILKAMREQMNNEKHVERIDALTGCANLLSFLEDFTMRLAAPPDSAFSILVIDLNSFMAFNNDYGRAQGDSVLHWVGIVLRDTSLPVYRIGSDEFLLAFHGENSEECDRIAHAVFERLNREGKQFNIG